MSNRSWGLLTLLAAIWGSTFYFVEIALRELEPFTLAFCRVSLAAAVLLVVLYGRGLRMPTALAAWVPFLVMGIFSNLVPFSAIFWGQTHISSGRAAILNATTPLFGVMVARLLVGLPLTASRMIGVLFGMAGVIVMVGPSLLGSADQNIAAQGAILLASCSYAFAGVYGRRFRDMPAIIPAAGQLTCSTLMLLPIAMIFDRPWQLGALDTSTIRAVLCLSLLCTAIAYLLYFTILAEVGPTNTLMVTFLIPIAAVALGAIALDEELDWQQFAGMGLILVGLVVIDGRLPARAAASRSQTGSADASSHG